MIDKFKDEDIMKTYIAFLRGINVGGSTSLPMAELRTICNDIGLKNVRTYIQSGNVIFQSELPEEMLIKKLEQALLVKGQKHIPVVIRTAGELELVISRNPFPDGNPSQVGVMFFVDSIPAGLLKDVNITGPEEVEISEREMYIHFPNGMGRSKLRLPLAQQGTVRNINTVTKLIELSREKVE
jgi:uncharacterized protein (DUF1697 family)